jgi:hypothetical protein
MFFGYNYQAIARYLNSKLPLAALALVAAVFWLWLHKEANKE